MIKRTSGQSTQKAFTCSPYNMALKLSLNRLMFSCIICSAEKLSLRTCIASSSSAKKGERFSSGVLKSVPLRPRDLDRDDWRSGVVGRDSERPRRDWGLELEVWWADVDIFFVKLSCGYCWQACGEVSSGRLKLLRPRRTCSLQVVLVRAGAAMLLLDFLDLICRATFKPHRYSTWCFYITYITYQTRDFSQKGFLPN